MADQGFVSSATLASCGTAAGRPFLLAPARALPLAPRGEASRQELEQAAAQIAAQVQGSHTQLSFHVDQDAGRLVVSVVDEESGTVLRQIPSEEALRIARALQRAQALLIEEVA